MSKLKKYKVAVTEVYRKVIIVLGASERDARRRAEDGWRNNEIILTPDDFEGTEYYVHPRPGGEEEVEKSPGEYVIQGYGAKDASEIKRKGTAKHGQ